MEPNKTTEKNAIFPLRIHIYRIAIDSLFGRYAFCFQRDAIGLELAGADTILYRNKLNK